MNLAFRQTRTPLASFTLDLDVTMGGRIHVVFGPSGSGKTTLIELVAGLRRPESGTIDLGSECFVSTAERRWRRPSQRRVGYVPQDLALFPHRTVRGNLEYGRRAASGSGIPWQGVVDALEIGDLLDRRVDLLSGGEKQRVALGRALLSQPRVLLLDEPLASLDGPLRLRLQRYVARLRDEFQVPMVLVTHDRSEALALGDQVTVLHHGRALQQGAVGEVFSRPASLAVASIVGTDTVGAARVEGLHEGLVSLALGRSRLWAVDPGGLCLGSEVYACIRAEEVLVVREVPHATSARNALPAHVVQMRPEGSQVRVELDAGFRLDALLSRPAVAELELCTGTPVRALVKASAVHLIAR